MNTRLLSIVRRIIAQNGESILADPARLKGVFSARAQHEPKPLRSAFGRCIENGAYSALKTAADAADRAARKASLVRRLRNEKGVDVNLSAEALDILEAALFETARAHPGAPLAALTSWWRVKTKAHRRIMTGAAAALVLGLTLGIVVLVRGGGGPGSARVYTVDLDGQVRVGTAIDFPGGYELSEELQWLAVQIACVGIYNNAQAGNYTVSDPQDYYRPEHIREFLTDRSGSETKTDMFYGICFNYAQAAYDDITRYAADYAALGLSEWYIAAVHDDPGEIVLYDPSSENDATLILNGVYVKEHSRHRVRPHGGAVRHGWLWAYGGDGTIYWIDPTWTDNTGYVWWGIVQDGEELQLNPLASLCVADIDPAGPGFAHYNRGNGSRSRGDGSGAIEDFDEAIRLDPDNASAYNNRGCMYALRGMYDRAREDFDAAIRIDPNFAPAWYNRGVAYCEMRIYNVALTDFNAALRINPNHANAYVGRGVAYDNQGMDDLAMADFNTALRIDPNNALAFSSRGNVYGKHQNWNLAFEDCNRALQLDSNIADAYKGRGLVYIYWGDYDRAVDDLNAALRIKPDYPQAQRGLEIARMLRGY